MKGTMVVGISRIVNCWTAGAVFVKRLKAAIASNVPTALTFLKAYTMLICV